jgi:MFS family permease
MLVWAFLADVVPLYPLYALLFADSGLSAGQISALFAVWSAVGLLAEVPSGALADRFGRRTALVVAGVLQAAGYVVWLGWPTFTGFAIGFALWGLGGALRSGAQEALLYDGLAAVGAEAQYARVNGWVQAAMWLSELPTAAAATLLYALGGYELVGWVSVGTCLAGAVFAIRLPEPAHASESDDGEPGYFATLRAGAVEAAARPEVRFAVLAVALVGGFDALEEYFPLITAASGVPTVAVPLAMVPITVAGALGAALGGAADRLGPGALAALTGASMVLLGLSGLVTHPAGLVGVLLCWGCLQTLLIVTESRLQHRIASRSRATATSVAALGMELTAFGIYATWAIGQITAVAVAGLVLAAGLPWLLRRR